MIPQAVLQLAQFCKEVGLFHFVLSPGSRSAPLVLALNRIGEIQFHAVADERSAAFTALGMAMGMGQPVGLVCTSGTAVLNYGPAIAEAFYQNVPLFVVTADRPPEWIDQSEGQAIRQNFVFQAHTRFSGLLPSMDESVPAQVHTRRILNEAWYKATAYPAGPVHLNVPLREPLYPTEAIDFQKFSADPISIQLAKPKSELDRSLLTELCETFNKVPNRLLVIGQYAPDWELRNSLKAIADYGQIPVLGDCLHNVKEINGLVSGTDWFKETFWAQNGIQPDLLITLGNGLISKSLKRFLSSSKPKEHWHVCQAGFPPDPNGTITRIIHADPALLLAKLAESAYFQGDEIQAEAGSFYRLWLNESERVNREVEKFAFKATWSDLKATELLLSQLPKHASVFLGNSMPIRYANWFRHHFKETHFIYANRGTSGIDGCISTSVGLARSKPDLPVIALVGDMSFFYDRNGLWTLPVPPNLKIAVLNNGGGNIFRIIPGSGQVPELEELFELDQPLKAGRTAMDSQMDYFRLTIDSDATSETIQEWLTSPNASILECITDKYVNAEVVRQMKIQFL